MKRCFLVSLYLVLVSVAMAQSPVPNSSHKLSPNTKLLMLEPDNSALFPLKNGNAYPCTFYHTIEHNIPSDIKYLAVFEPHTKEQPGYNGLVR